MLKRTLSQIKDESLREMHFLVAPYEILFSQSDQNIYTLQLEKGYQIIGSLKNTIQNSQNKQKVALKFYQNIIKFRLFSQKNVQYQWSLYKRVDQLDEMIQTKKFNLQQTFKKQNKNGCFDESVIFDNTKIQLKFFIFRASSPKQLQIMVLNKRKQLNLYDQDFPLSQLSNNKKSTKTIKFMRSESQESNKYLQKSKIIAKSSDNTQKQNKQIQENNSFIAQAKIIQQQNQQYLQKTIDFTNKQNELTVKDNMIQISKYIQEVNNEVQILSPTKQPLKDLQQQNDFIEQPVKLKNIIQQNQNQNMNKSLYKQQHISMQQNHQQDKQCIVNTQNYNNNQEQILIKTQNHHCQYNIQHNKQEDQQINSQQTPLSQIPVLNKEEKQQIQEKQNLFVENLQQKQTISTQNQIKQTKITNVYSFKTKAFIFIIIMLIISLVYTFVFLDLNTKSKKQTLKKNKNPKPEKAKSTKIKN